MAAPPPGAFARPQGRPLAGMENKYPRAPINPNPRSVQWTGADLQRLHQEAKAGKSATELQEIFPTRSLKSIQHQIEGLFGGFRKIRGTTPGGKRYPTLKDDEFSQLHPSVQQLAGEVIGFPKSLQDQDRARLKGRGPALGPNGEIIPDPPFGFDPAGDMSGGGKVLPGPGYTASLEDILHGRG